MQHEIRKMLRKKRQIIADQHKIELSKKLCDNFMLCYPALRELKNKKIASYYPSNEEISPFWITQTIKALHEIYYPVIHPFRNHLLYFFQESEIFYVNKYGLKEPKFDANTALAPWEIDIFIIPLVGFNALKNRIGMGGGFYDNSLKMCKKFNKETQFIGIAFDEQKIDTLKHNLVEMNAWDIKMDVIVTPNQIIK